jgi:GR25 family glycosyltransferase involved in LPS biosynthesis
MIKFYVLSDLIIKLLLYDMNKAWILLLLTHLMYLYILQLYFRNQIGQVIKTPLQNSENRLKIDAIYLINLKRRSDRLSSFMKSLCKSDLGEYHGLIEHYEAVDGNEIDISSVDIHPDSMNLLRISQIRGVRQTHSELTIGAIGCYLSHVGIWELIQQRGQSFAIVCEDDAVVPERLLDYIQCSMSSIPEDWDVILCGFSEFSENQIDNIMNKTVIRFLDHMQPTIRSLKHFFGTHFYIIRAQGIDKLKRSYYPIRYQIDSFLSMSDLNIYTIGKNLVKQSSSPTDIQTLKSDHNIIVQNQ